MTFDEWYEHFVVEQLNYYTTESHYLAILESMYNVAFNAGYTDGKHAAFMDAQE